MRGYMEFPSEAPPVLHKPRNPPGFGRILIVQAGEYACYHSKSEPLSSSASLFLRWSWDGSLPFISHLLIRLYSSKFMLALLSFADHVPSLFALFPEWRASAEIATVAVHCIQHSSHSRSDGRSVGIAIFAIEGIQQAKLSTITTAHIPSYSTNGA